MKILHFNDEEKALHKYLADRGQENVILPAEADVFAHVRSEAFDAAFVGLHPHGSQLLRALQRQNPDCMVTIITSDRNARSAVEAMKLGAFDYLFSPLDFTEVERTVIMMTREHESQRERRSLEGQLTDAPLRGRLSEIISKVETRAIRQALDDYAGNVSQAAKALAISRTTLYSKMKTYGLSV